MHPATLLLIDSDDYSASVLLHTLQRLGFGDVAHVRHGLEVPQAVGRLQPDAVLFNHHFDRPDELMSCCTAKLTRPGTAVAVIAAAGPAMKTVQAWSREAGCVDVVIEKPVPDERLSTTLAALCESRRTQRALQARAHALERLLPDGALAALDGGHGESEEVFEAAVLFTDIRRSSDLITRVPPREFFRLLNESLAAQARLIRAYEGAVVKYTGDGLMAVFRGRGRAWLATRCAMALAGNDSQALLPFGLGLAEGLVLAGLVGATADAAQRRQYDVIGATVHLAARLCGLAAPGQVMATGAVYASSRLDAPGLRPVGPVLVRGFRTPIDCVTLGAQPAPQAA